MEKRSILCALMVIVYSRRVNTFACYVTQIGSSPINGLLYKAHEARNCKDQPNNLLPIPINLPDERLISCFKMVGKDSNGDEVAIKGCIPTGTCNAVKDSILLNSKKMDHVGFRLPEDTKCYECESDGCNTAPRFGTSGVFIFVLSYIYGTL